MYCKRHLMSNISASTSHTSGTKKLLVRLFSEYLCVHIIQHVHGTHTYSECVCVHMLHICQFPTSPLGILFDAGSGSRLELGLC